MAGRIRGLKTWEGSRDSKGYRTYKAKFHLEGTSYDDGPFTMMLTPGLPIPGSFWNYGNDLDPWAWCRPDIDLQNLQQKDGHKSKHWHATFTYSSEPLNRCQDAKVENPLLEPPDISGGYSNHTEEATHDRFGQPITTSSHELIRGQQNEWDASKLTIRIKQNVATPYLGYILPNAMMHCVNAFPIWGLPARCVKLSSAPFSIKYYGTCSAYYERNLEFELDPRTFDRDLLDEGTKVLSGRWDEVTGEWVLIPIAGYGGDPNPDATNPSHFIKYMDRHRQHTKVILDGAGKPYVESQPLVTECNVCPDGMARWWRVSGFVAPAGFVVDPADVNNMARYNGLILDHQDECIWQGAVGEGPAEGRLTLSLDRHGGIGVPTWTLTESITGNTWTLESTEWDCNGPNRLERGGVIVQDNDIITLSPTSSSEPGTVHIEKYPEANFYLLGVPVFF